MRLAQGRLGAVCLQLGSRRKHQLLVRYWKEPKSPIREGIEHVAYHFDNAEVTSLMQRVMTQQIKNGEKEYWPIAYLAKKCNETALKELSSGRYRGEGSLQYDTSVELFGKCRFRPATQVIAT